MNIRKTHMSTSYLYISCLTTHSVIVCVLNGLGGVGMGVRGDPRSPVWTKWTLEVVTTGVCNRSPES